jgi:hypothetical protein
MPGESLRRFMRFWARKEFVVAHAEATAKRRISPRQRIESP